MPKQMTRDFGKGFTVANLKNMRQFYLTFPNGYALRSELSWTHYRLPMRVENDNAREFYMQEIFEKMKEADVIAFASPVYFYSWNALMKRAIDRTIAVEASLTNKTFYLISAGQAPAEQYMAAMIDSFRKYIGCFRGEGNREGGYVFGYGTDKPGDVEGTEAMDLAYKMGLSV